MCPVHRLSSITFGLNLVWTKSARPIFDQISLVINTSPPHVSLLTEGLIGDKSCGGLFSGLDVYSRSKLFFSQIQTRRCGEMVDTWLSKSHGEICVGSSPTSGTP